MTLVCEQTLAEVQLWLRPRPRHAHKGDFGHVLVVGGDYGMAGAVRLASEAALRVGAGLVTVATRPEHVVSLYASRPESLCYGISETAALLPLLERATVIVIGPGLGQTAWARAVFRAAIAVSKPMVIDADGLNILAAEQPTPVVRKAILTPHPGEAARLLGCTVCQIQADRVAAIQQLQARYQTTCVLKGAGSLILGADGHIYRCQAGNPGMASGGMGDVLSGIIGGLLAQGLGELQAARLGVQLHAEAGDRAASILGERGLLASDLFLHLSCLVNP